MKPSDAKSSRFVTFSLVFVIFLLGYYYHEASSIADTLLNEVDRLQTAFESANKTLMGLRTEGEGCLANVKVVEESLKKTKTESDEKDKTIKEKTEAEKKAQDEVSGLKKEKDALDKKLKETAEKCKKDCDQEVEKAKELCKAQASVAASQSNNPPILATTK